MVRKNFQAVELIKNINNIGFSKASNQGIRYALENNAEYILLLNNDIEITNGKWLESLIDVLESDSKIGIAGCKLLYPNGKIQHAGGIINLTGGHNRGECEDDIGLYDKMEFLKFVTGAVLLIKSEVVRKIGLLDEGFTPLYYEDVDWCIRAKLYGYKVAYSPNPTLIHNCGSSAKKLNHEVKAFYLRRSFIRYFLLNFHFSDILKRIAKFETRIAIGCLIGRSQNGKFHVALRSDASNRLRLFFEAWFWSLGNLKNICSLRKQRFSLNRNFKKRNSIF